MRVAGIPLAYCSVQDVQKFCPALSSADPYLFPGLQDAILQALAVCLALQGVSSSEHFLEQRLGHMEPDPEIPSTFNSLQRSLIYSISLAGDTDNIATMAGAIAGAYYGVEQVPESWQQSCEETDVLAQSLHRVFQESP